MGQVAFDTLQASEELETAGISREQARAISLVVRKSHEVADVATKRDLEDVRKDLTAQITDVRKDMEARFEKTDAQIADVRKDLSAEIADVRKDLSAEIADVRKDIANRFDKLGLQMTVRMGGMLIAAVGLMTAILKVLK
ncbi:coiled-coil domain-containing protein [Sodalis endosymbiont of Spalangia cameroni]|uniref:coiled-coil domain-containing protein n=1 Tax=Sodalis praecaptivus TaxID=1239307 RepID=UPI0031F9828C